MTSQRRWILFGVSVIAGACIWLLTPYFTGKEHAFRAPGYYRSAIIISGAILGAIEPRGIWLWPIGLTLGQLAVFFILGSGPLMRIVLVFIVVPTTIVSFAAAAVGALIVLLIRHLKTRPAPDGAENES